MNTHLKTWIQMTQIWIVSLQQPHRWFVPSPLQWHKYRNRDMYSPLAVLLSFSADDVCEADCLTALKVMEKIRSGSLFVFMDASSRVSSYRCEHWGHALGDNLGIWRIKSHEKEFTFQDNAHATCAGFFLRVILTKYLIIWLYMGKGKTVWGGKNSSNTYSVKTT